VTSLGAASDNFNGNKKKVVLVALLGVSNRCEDLVSTGSGPWPLCLLQNKIHPLDRGFGLSESKLSE